MHPIEPAVFDGELHRRGEVNDDDDDGDESCSQIRR